MVHGSFRQMDSALQSIPSLRISILSPDFVIIVNTFIIFTFVTVICLVLPIVSNLFPVSYELLLVRLLILCGMLSELPMLHC